MQEPRQHAVPSQPSKMKNGRHHFHGFRLTESDMALLPMLADWQRQILTTKGGYRDIADQLSLPLGTVRSRLHRARAALAALRSDPSKSIESFG